MEQYYRQCSCTTCIQINQMQHYETNKLTIIIFLHVNSFHRYNNVMGCTPSTHDNYSGLDGNKTKEFRHVKPRSISNGNKINNHPKEHYAGIQKDYHQSKGSNIEDVIYNNCYKKNDHGIHELFIDYRLSPIKDKSSEYVVPSLIPGKLYTDLGFKYVKIQDSDANTEWRRASVNIIFVDAIRLCRI